MADLFVPPTGIPANAVTLGLVDAQVWLELPEHSRASVEGESATESSRESLIQRLGRLIMNAAWLWWTSQGCGTKSRG